MSGSGGFYKYHCKNFLTYNCQNWVFVNNAPCADCCAAGRDDQDGLPGTSALSEMEIGVPIFQNGVLRYALVEMVVSTVPGDSFTTWTPRQTTTTRLLRLQQNQQHQQQNQQQLQQQDQLQQSLRSQLPAHMQLPPHTA